MPVREVDVPVLKQRSLTLGRAPTNDVVLSDDTVSWNHAMVSREGGRLWIKDLGSSNGTFVDGNRVNGTVPLEEHSVVRLGTTAELHFRATHPVPTSHLSWVIEDLGNGLRFSFRGDRLGIGPQGDLRVVGGEAVLLLTGEDEVWLGVDGDDRPLEPGEVFEVGSRRFALVQADGTRDTTRVPARARYPYELEATLNGPTGAEARLLAPEQRLDHMVSAENRAVLLYMLGQRMQEDESAGKEEGDRGWCSDEEIAIGIWGRDWSKRNLNGLHVLVYRLRKELEKAGFDPWFIEKKKRYIRGRFREIRVD